jgi:hypothetical protein
LSSPRRRVTPAIAALLVAAGLAGCSLLPIPTPDPRAAALRTLDEAEARWRATGIVDYTYDLARSCFCPELAVTISVVAGETRAVTKDGRPARAEELVSVPVTIPELFAVIRRELGRGADAGPATIRYDAARGFPMSASFDPIVNAIDDEYSFTVSNLRLPD